MTEADRPGPDRGAPDPALEGLPHAYADWRRSTLGRITDALEERLLLDRIGPVRGLRILDVGCGDGVLATRLAKGGAWVTGIDASANMIAAARHRAKAAGFDVDLVEGNAGDLPFPSGHFDCVVSVATLCFVDDPRPTIREGAESPSCLGGLAVFRLRASRGQEVAEVLQTGDMLAEGPHRHEKRGGDEHPDH